MNKQQYGAGPSGLPARPPTVNMPGPAPPLPPGPPPPQPPYPQQQQPQQDQAAHAAAWAAYYQSQAQATGGAYAGTAQPAATAGAANPYANYGYSALASAQHSAHVQQPQYQAPPASAPYRPPPAQTYPQTGPAQPYPTQPYTPSYPQQSQQYPQQYPQQPAQPYNWQQPGASGQPAQQPYRPPAAGPQQPYYPQQNQPYSPVRPTPTPGPTVGQHRPYQPAPRVPSNTGRPPMGNSPSHPPAKRPRFDGPGGPPSGPASNNNNNFGNMSMQNRPPQQNIPPVRPSGLPGNNPNIRPPPNFPVRPVPASLPSAPRAATGQSGSTPNKPNLPAPPVVREPIHMGFGPVPSLASSGLGGGGRGGAAGGRGGHAGPRGMRGGRGGNHGAGLPNAPRGPSQMRRGHDHSRSHRERDREIHDRKRREKSKDVNQKEDKTTLTDFRIVGIEVKSLGWTWGQIGHEVDDVEEEVGGVEDDPVIAPEQATKVETEGVKEEEAVTEVKEEVETESEAKPNELTAKEEEEPDPTSVKSEAVESSETVEGKRGEKRKAKTPEGDEGASSPKKRSNFHLLTHGKPNESSSATAATAATAIHEFNQNRFRIYFESPAELDRVPKAMRRNPNKRWRRATSSVAPAPAGQEAVGQTARESTAATQATLEEVGEEAEVSETVPPGGEPAVDVTKDGEDVPDTQAAEDLPQSVGEQATEPVSGLVLATVEEEGHTQTETDEVARQQTNPSAVAEESENTSTIVTSDEAGNNQPTAEDAPEMGDISMVTDPGIVAAAIEDLVESAQPAASEDGPANDGGADIGGSDAAPTEVPEIKVESTEEKPAASAVESEVLAQSAENTASAYKSRTRRRSSVSSHGSNEDLLADLDIPTPSLNRISILYQESQRRLCLDASVVSSMTIDRGEAKIDLEFKSIAKGGEEQSVPKGVLAEYYDMEDQRFAALSGDKLAEFEKDASSPTLPPFHRASFEEPLVLTVYLNKKRPLSEPKWCRMNTADEWLVEQFGAVKAKSETGWMGKLKVADPDPPPTLQTILAGWASSSSIGTQTDRRSFTESLQSDPNNLLEILLRLARGERNPTASANASSSHGSLGPLATAIRADSPYASHQTHVSLAILAMYRLTTDYAAKAGEKSEVVNEKISDIIKSLPEGMIHRSLDGLFKEWQAK